MAKRRTSPNKLHRMEARIRDVAAEPLGKALSHAKKFFDRRARSAGAPGVFKARARVSGGLTLDGFDTDLLVLLDVPRFPTDPLSCAARHDDLTACDLDRGETEAALGPHHDAERTALADADHGTALDPLPLVCDADTCPHCRRIAAAKHSGRSIIRV